MPILLGVGAFIVVLGIIGAVTGGGKKDDSASKPAAASSAPAAAVSDSPKPAETKAAPATTKAAPAKKVAPAGPVTVLKESGHGIKSTATFSVKGDWDLKYTYDCSSFGFKGNFMVSDGGLNYYVNELGMKGSDVTHLHDGEKQHLEVNSECSWTIQVIDL